jgi:hypothetical protein
MQPPPSPRAEFAPLGAAARRSAAAAVPRLATGVTAFVGRALRGPVNEATLVGSFAEFQQRFGGLWQPAPMGYALEQYFEQGGRDAIIVRVANGGRSPSLALPAGRGSLPLRGCAPGTREYLRASVDYDGVPAGDELQFNLVLQRLRAPESELIDDQEIHRLVTVQADSPRCVTQALKHSRLMRVAGPLPALRPDRTGLQGKALVSYVAAHADGTDGEPLSDYDLIGDREAGTGLFALLAGPRFDLLCLPPPAREQDLGPTALLVAARICRASQALLVVDPPSTWETPEAALSLMPGWPFRSEDALMAFPRLLGQDRLRGRAESFAPCGAVAGLLARASGTGGYWGEPGLLRAGLRPRCEVEPQARAQLARLGINSFDVVRPRPGEAPAWRTLVAEGTGSGFARELTSRRFALWLQACVLEGTRWLLQEAAAPDTFTRARTQVDEFLAGLAAEGRLASSQPGEGYYVICDQRLHGEQVLESGGRRLLFAFALQRPGEFQCCLVSHEPGGSSVRTVAVNQLAEPGSHRALQFGTALLRQLEGPGA